MTAQSVFEELRFIWELLAADFIFLLPFAKRRKNFAPLVLLGVPALSLLSLIHFPLLALGSSLPGVWGYAAVSSGYILLAVATMLFSRLCFSLTVSDALYFCTAGYAAQHFVYVLVHEVLARAVWPALPERLLLYILVSAAGCCLFFVPMYLTFSPRLTACGGRMFEDKPARIGANLFLLTVLIACTFACQHLFEFVEEARLLGAALGGMVCFLILSVQYQTLSAVRSGQERVVIEQMLRDSGRHYAYSKELIDMVNRTVHDLKHTLRALRQADEGAAALHRRDGGQPPGVPAAGLLGQRGAQHHPGGKGLRLRAPGHPFLLLGGRGATGLPVGARPLRPAGQRHRQRH